MTDIEDIDRSVFEAYDRECQKIANCIYPLIPIAGDENTFNGRKWCEENDIPESAFADAVVHWIDEASYGVSPMYPWLNVDK